MKPLTNSIPKTKKARVKFIVIRNIMIHIKLKNTCMTCFLLCDMFILKLCKITIYIVIWLRIIHLTPLWHLNQYWHY